MSLVWLSLALGVILTIVAAVYLTIEGLEAFRAVKQLGRRARPELERISAVTAEIEQRLAASEARTTRLEASLTRLRSSRAELNVLTSALAEVNASVRGVTSIVPRK
jgi:hypothetical protein